MILVCANCGFIFERIEFIDQCPDCGKFSTKAGSEEENNEYLKIKSEREIKDSNL